MRMVEKFQEEHKNNKSSIYVTDPKTAQTIHVATECAFYRMTGLKWTPYQKGKKSDGHVDFMIPKPYNIPIDVKGAGNVNTLGLLVTVDTVNATKQTCFVHGVFDDWYVMFRGYAWSSELRKRKPRDYGLGVLSHGIEDEKLNPMGKLLNIIRSTQTPEDIAAAQEVLL